MPAKRILIVEDEHVVAEQLKQTLVAYGYDVIGVADSGEQAIAKGKQNRPDLIVMDIMLSGSVDGISAAKELQPLGIPVIYLTAYLDPHLVDRAQDTEPLAYLSKPASNGELTAAIQLALFKREREKAREREGHGEIRQEEEADERSRLMVANVTDHAIFTLDTFGNVNSWNSGAERINGYSTEDIIGRPFSVLFTDEDREKNVPEHELELARPNGSAEDTRWLVRQNGERYWADGTVTAIRNETGVLTGFTKIARDSTERKQTQEALRNHKERLRIALHAARMGTWLWDIRTDIDTFDDSLCKLFGLSPGQGVSTIQNFYSLIHVEDRPRVEGSFEQTRREGVHLDTEFRIVRPDGVERWFLDQGEVVRDEEGQPQYMTGACVDITERKQAELALRQSEERFRLFVNNVRDYALFQLDIDGHIVTWNSGAEQVLGYTTEEIVGQPSAKIFVPEDVATGQPQKEMREAATTGRSSDERWHLRKNGSRFWARGVLTVMQDDAGRLRGFAKIMRDETERRAANQKLEASLKEKEILLKEIHHRVKNNLQVIISLLSLQSESVENEAVRVLFDEACNRVRSIGDIHELLYRSPDLASIPFDTYLDRLSKYLLSFYGVDSNGIHLTTSANIELPISEAITCGLIVNELLTNSLKHAFPQARPGSIRISLNCEAHQCVLEVTDDGVGLPQNFNLEGGPTLGLKLVSVLARQLRGDVRVQSPPGTRFSIAFPRPSSDNLLPSS